MIIWKSKKNHHNIFKQNENESLSTNQKKFNATLKIKKNTKKQYLIQKNKFQIFKKKINDTIKKYHDESLQKHSNVNKILQFLRRNYQFSQMKQQIETYIKQCFNCQQNKHETHAKYDEIQYNASSNSSWNEITMNFITKLSKSIDFIIKKKYDSILIMMNKFIKYFHMISFKKRYNAEQLKFLILNRRIWYHEIFKTIINDKNKFFTFNYWKTLISLLKTKLKLSTIYHFKTNDQIERTNQNFEQYLKHYINKTQSNWISFLSMTQLTINAKISNTTKMSSFFANFEKKFNLFEFELSNKSTQSTIQKIKTFKRIHDNIFKMQKKSTIYQKKNEFQLKKNKIYLFTKNLKIKKSNKKLNHVKIESFFIKNQKSRINYEFELSQNTRIHSIFHISLLKSIDSNTFIQKNFHYESKKKEFEIKNILNKKNQKYFVKWKKYFTSKNTWKSIKHLKNCQKLKKFHQKNQKKNQQKRRK